MHGHLGRFSWGDPIRGGPSDDSPNWTVAASCQSPNCLAYSHLTLLIVDGMEVGRGTGRFLNVAKEEAARQALKRLTIQNHVLPLVERRVNAP